MNDLSGDTELLCDLDHRVFFITLNNVAKHNAFDDNLLKTMQIQLEQAIANPLVRVIVLQAQGRDFCAGADVAWMQRMAQFTEQENIADAQILARLMATLYHCPKPTIAVVQGGAFGGGAGLVAACDIAIAAKSARFCFSEVKLGLIPAVISPYVVKAIGERAAKWLFMSAQVFDAQQAQQLQLVQHCVNDDELWFFAHNYARKISQLAPQAVIDCKSLLDTIRGRALDEQLSDETAILIAKKRVSGEGQQGLRAFLNKETPRWD